MSEMRQDFLGDAELMVLAEMLQLNTSLALIQLKKNAIGDDGALALGAALKRTRQLAALDLGRNGIDDDGLVAIARGMEANESIEELRLWGNAFGQPSAQLFHGLIEQRFKYLGVSADFATNVVDGVVDVAQVDI